MCDYREGRNRINATDRCRAVSLFASEGRSRRSRGARATDLRARTADHSPNCRWQGASRTLCPAATSPRAKPPIWSATSTLKLVQRLHTLRVNAGEKAIVNFRGYVAVTAYHACGGYLRKNTHAATASRINFATFLHIGPALLYGKAARAISCAASRYGEKVSWR